MDGCPLVSINLGTIRRQAVALNQQPMYRSAATKHVELITHHFGTVQVQRKVSKLRSVPGAREPVEVVRRNPQRSRNNKMKNKTTKTSKELLRAPLVCDVALWNLRKQSGLESRVFTATP